MENNNKNTSRDFFAAQNSYYGFINHFDSVFNPEKYQKIFILKGGPGTGKSSLMKRIANRFENMADVTKIYCSSDINSLDGVIISKGGQRIAILDGTAPHERDAVIPGAIDELVNLGEFWDSAKLELKREKILSLNKEKKKHYKSAYDFLSVAGMYSKKIKSTVDSLFDKAKLKEHIDSICKNLEKGVRCDSDMLHSAFGKGGYQTLRTAFLHAEKQIQITGGYFSSQIFINSLCDEMKQREIKHSVYRSPLDPNDYETVVVSDKEKSIAYTTRFCEDKLSIDRFLFKSPNDLSELKTYMADYEKYEQLAKESFACASKTHFLLEDIYSPLMDFSLLDKTISSLEEKICQVIE